MVNRRKFLQLSGAGIGGAVVLSTSTLALTGCSQSEIQTAINDLPVAENAVDISLTLVATASGLGFLSPAAVAAINVVMAEVKIGLVAVGTDLASYKNNPDPSVIEQIDTALSAISANLSTALTTANITDPVTLATLLGIFALIKGFVSIVQTLIPAAATASLVRKTAQQKLRVPSTLPTKEQFASLINATLVLSRPEYQSLQVSTTR